MRYRMTALLLLAAAIAAFVLVGCGGKEDAWTFAGTWVNSAYNGHRGAPPGKLIMTATSLALYDNDYDPTPVQAGSFAVGSDWTGDGEHYFKGIAVLTPNTYYFLLRVTNQNNTMESSASTTSYPTTIDPLNSMYGMWARQ